MTADAEAKTRRRTHRKKMSRMNDLSERGANKEKKQKKPEQKTRLKMSAGAVASEL